MIDVPLESQEALVLADYLRYSGLRFFHCPNESGRTPEMRRRAIRLQREGVSPGVPDYFVLIPPTRSIDGNGYLLAIELKRRKGGKLSLEQQQWLDVLNDLQTPSVAAYRANGAGEAIEIIEKHLKHKQGMFDTF